MNFLLLATTARAATFTVTTVDDTHDDTWGDMVCADASSQCSLRAAVEEANAWPGADVIDLTAVSGFLYLGNTGDPSIDEDGLYITESVTISGDADYVYRYCPASVAYCDVFGIYATDVTLESFGVGADPGFAGQETVGIYDAGYGNLAIDRVDFVDLYSGLDTYASPGEVRVSRSLFWGNDWGVAGLASVSDSYFYQNGVGAAGTGRIVTSDFVDNSVGAQICSSSVWNSTFVDNELGVEGCSAASTAVATIGTSSFSGNARHFEGRGSAFQTTFGPNDSAVCEAPVVAYGTMTASRTIFTAPSCGTAPACSGTLSVPPGAASLVENIGDASAPDCALLGSGTWLYGVDGSPLDPQLDALESHRTFTSDLFGSIDGGEAHPLLSTSPAVDAGGRPLARPDLAGNLFLYDGNGDGRRARDLGALEYVP